jgi:UDP-2,3-diacylglucosamine pyrophosphatase LpxH
VVLNLDKGEKAWIFHGDVFDVTMQHSKWLTRLGAVGYDLLIRINGVANFCSERILNKGKISLSKKIKNSVKTAVKYINNFEETAASIGISNGYQYVVCGHIHHPEIKEITTSAGSITYLNSGDWIENLSALEYHRGKWTVHKFSKTDEEQMIEKIEDDAEPNNQELFQNLLREFNISIAS